MKRVIFIVATAILGLVVSSESVLAQGQSSNRSEIAAESKWDLSDIFTDWDTWEASLEKIPAMFDEIIAMKGTINTPENLVKLMKKQETLSILASKLFQYPNFMYVLNARNMEAAMKLQKISGMFAQYSPKLTWITPELLLIPEAKMMQWVEKTPALNKHKFDMVDLYRQQKHVLSEEKQTLLSYFGTFNGSPSSIYSNLSVTDIEYPSVKFSDGEEAVVTRGVYSKLLRDMENQEDRKKAFEGHYGVYKKLENTYAAIYKAVCAGNWAAAQAHGYTSSLESRLDGNKIPTDVYRTLIETAKKNTAPLRRYSDLRKKVLKLKESHVYDGSIPLVNYEKEYPYEDAKKLVYDAVAPMGAEYQKKVKFALDNNWIDVYENTGKQPGAFSSNVYGVHSYIKLNYNGTMNYIFTLIHELGHSLHSILSCDNQPYATHSYTIFVAEVASTFNERLLLNHLLKNSKDQKERIVLLNQAIENILGTFYAQAMFADFELQAHELAEKGAPITAPILNGIMAQLFEDYYGRAKDKDELAHVLWTRISHFFEVPFYVYQYATSFAASAQIYERVMNGTDAEKKKALDQYFTLLKSGGNDYPINQLKKAGVDLTNSAAVEAVVKQLDELVTQLETELEKL